MSANIFKLSAIGGLNLTRIKPYGANVKGWNIVNTTAAALYVKLWFYIPGSVTPGVDAPTPGTTSPNVTILVPAVGTTTGAAVQSFADGISMKGDLWMATTVNAVDGDSTGVAGGSLIISLFLE